MTLTLAPLFTLLRKVSNIPLRILGIQFNDMQWSLMEQFIRFALVGVANTIVVLVVYYFIIFVFGGHWYLIGETLGYASGIFCSYLLNSSYVFRHKSKSAFLKMFLCYGVTYVLQMGMLYGLVDCLNLSERISILFVILITTPVNFVLNRCFAFTSKS